ncbi:MAG: isoprenyl transferase [Clostridia bacterium]
MRKFLKKKEENIVIPQHIAIIMDGNGRWAKKRGLPRNTGHKAGAKALENIAEYANQIGVHHLTVYAFSTENWSRPKEEVDGIMELFEQYLEETCVKILDKNIKMNFFGDLSVLSEKLLALIAKVEELSKQCTGNSLNLCINYGGRHEIVSAVNKLIEQGKSEITAEDLQKSLYTGEIPDPDLIIRPSGELRLSNFLLWQSAYSEFYFDDILWPDFSKKHLDAAILSYSKRQRRFGGI